MAEIQLRHTAAQIDGINSGSAIVVATIAQRDALSIVNNRMTEGRMVIVEDNGNGVVEMFKYDGAGGYDPFDFGDVIYFGDSETDTNWRIRKDGSLLKMERRESGVWIARSTIGNSITTDKYILQDFSGRLNIIKGDGSQVTLLKGSIDGNGVVLGNTQGRIALIHNGELLSFTPQGEPFWLPSGSTQTTYETLDSFQINNTIGINAVVYGVRLTFQNVPVNTVLRYSIELADGTLLGENVTEFEFSQGIGDSITNGLNEVLLADPIPLRAGASIIIKYEFNNTVDIMGGEEDLGLPGDPKFYPNAEERFAILDEYEVTTENNVVTQLEAKTGEDRLDISAVKNTDQDIVDVDQLLDNSVQYTRRDATTVIIYPKIWEYQYAENLNTVTISSDSAGTDIVEITNYEFASGGKYEIKVVGSHSTTNANREMFSRILFNGIEVQERYFSVTETNQQYELTQHYIYDSTGDDTITVKYNCQKDGVGSTVSMAETTLEIRRVE